MAGTDYSTLSDEELEKLIAGKDVTQSPPGQGAQVMAARNAAVTAKQERANPPATAEEIMPSAVDRFFAGMGGRMQEPFVRGAEKLNLMFPGRTPEAEAATLRRVGDERSQRMGRLRELEDTAAGQAGGFLGMAAPAAVAPQSIPAQMATMGGLGFLAGGADRPTGFGSEMATSGLHGATDALATGAAMKGLQLAGKGINASRGRFTPEGQTALELDAAAARLGLPRPTIGQLDPSAPEIMRQHPDLVRQQAEALKSAMAGRRTVPNPAGGTMDESVPGGRLTEGVRDAVGVRRQQARQMYTAVDDYAAQEGLSNVPANYTVNTLSAANKLTAAGKAPTGNNIVFNLLDGADPDAFAWLKAAGNPQAARQQGMTMTQYHDARVAVGKSLNSLERKNPADLTADQIDAKRILSDLKTALDSDVERWAKSNAKNEPAMQLYNRAKEFYATTGAEVLNNPLSRKFVSRSRGFVSPEKAFEAVANPANRTLVDRLLPTADRPTRDMLTLMRDLPDVGRTVATGKVPASAAEGVGMRDMLAAAGHPGMALAEFAPGLRWATQATPAKKLYFAETPKGRYMGPAAQYPAGALETWARERMSQGRR